MNNMKTSQVQRTMHPTSMAQVPAPAPAPTMVTITRFAPPPAESIHQARAGHWAVYMFAAVLCLATTIFVSSNAGQGVLDILMQY